MLQSLLKLIPPDFFSVGNVCVENGMENLLRKKMFSHPLSLTPFLSPPLAFCDKWDTLSLHNAPLCSFGKEWSQYCLKVCRTKTRPLNRNHKSLAIGNHNFEVASFSRRNRSKITVSQSLSGPLQLRVQSRSRTRLRIAASIAFSFRACFKGF